MLPVQVTNKRHNPTAWEVAGNVSHSPVLRRAEAYGWRHRWSIPRVALLMRLPVHAGSFVDQTAYLCF